MVKIVHASTASIVDAEGNSRKLAIVGCGNCKGLIVAINNMQAMHMSRAEAELLIECCRTGEASPLARPGQLAPDCMVITQNVSKGGRWLLFFEPTGVVKFMCSGVGAADPASNRIAMTRKFLGELGDMLFETLTRSAAPEARA